MRSFLAPFDGSTLGNQLGALRADVKKQLGVNPLDADELKSFGLDPSQPWAVASDQERAGLRRLSRAASDPNLFLARFSKLVADTQLIDKPAEIRQGARRIYVYQQPFGSVMLEQYALVLADKAVFVTMGDGGAERLKQWPERDSSELATAMAGKAGDPRSFQKYWKRAESDGSAPGAAVRIVARDSAHILPPSLAAAPSVEAAQVRAAINVSAHRVELHTLMLGVSPERMKALCSPSLPRTGPRLLRRHRAVRRSHLAAASLLKLLHEVTVLDPMLMPSSASSARRGRQAGQARHRRRGHRRGDRSERRKGEEAAPCRIACARCSIYSRSPPPRPRKPADLDAALKTLQATMKERGIGATLEPGDPPKLRALTISERSPATLSRNGDLLVYGVGPGAFDRLRSASTRRRA